ncbi:helix-loop-helix DNA-binding domain-containing protein [Colletotrichum karsti]|uniref:Helix-loop-helix DNA-binding domain-containing protein n=1 Tax=Colletotrichum karsti TaxID=1095194 RepID=A0A9P6I5P2_9PEZI|nr:helix-loop-helix DNA-binding domain-containing protein [Colletotrichum karsti]KAF9876489.1 helix-loop-helix DNA-binding domain-containing protein [Colletotrichum karsti]
MDAQRPASQKLPAGLAGVLNPDENRDSAYFSSTDASSKHNSAASCANVLSPTGSGYQSSLADKTPSPITANLVPHPLVSPAQSNMSVASMVSPTTPGSADPRRFERPISLDSGHQLLAHDLGSASRRESVDSRINQGFHDMRLGGNSPYASHNQSTTSIQNTLNQQRNPRPGLDNLSVHRISNGYQPSNDRNPDPNPKIIRTAPAITGPATSNIARAAEPTKGQAWAFPEEEIQRIGPHDAYLDSRRSSVAESIASSQFTTESRLPPGQRRLDEPADYNNRLSSTSSEFPPVHHHSLQHKQIGDLRDDDAASRTGSQPYSRTPELRKSHKLAERKRRTEMKELFDQLRDLMPQERGSKASKWEILTKAISEHQRMAELIRIVQGQNTSVVQENEGLRQDNHNLRVDIQRLQNELHNLRLQQSPTGQAPPPQVQVAPPPPQQASYQTDPYANRRELPPIRGLNGAMPNGPESMTGVQYEAPRMNGYRPERNSIRRTATRASLTRAVSTATSAAPKTQSIAFALRSVNAARCFSIAAPRAFSNSIARLEEQRDQRSPDARRMPVSEHCVFVQNYPFQITRDELTEAFSKFGQVVHVHTPMKKTFCFVYYKTAEEAQAAADNVDGTFWHGRRIVVKVSEPKGRRESPASGNNNTRRERKPQYSGPPTNTIFIGNLSFDATDAELNQLFSVFNNVKDVRVAVDKHTGWPRGFAHAEFKTLEDAAAGIEAVNGKELRGRNVIANYAPERKEDADAAQAAEQSKHQKTDWNA